MIKIFLISDIEGKRLEFPANFFDTNQIDLILIAGDITFGSRSPSRVEKTLTRMAQTIPSSINVYFVPGNHDYPFMAEDHDWFPNNFIQCHNKVLEISIKDSFFSLLGFGGATMGLYNQFAFEEEDIITYLENLFNRKETNNKFSILLLHDPPRNTELDKTHQDEHVGSQSIYNKIEKFQPNLCVCGHIHESKGIDHIGNTTIINAGDWKFNKNYAILSIDSNLNISAEFYSLK